MPIERPFCKLHLHHKVRSKPDAVLHFLSRERPLRAPSLGQVSKRTNAGLQTFQLAPHVPPQPRHESIAYLAGEHRLIAATIGPGDEHSEEFTGPRAVSSKVNGHVEL